MNNDIAPDSEDVPAASQDARPAVIIVGPPWPRSGTARVMQNQIDYYRNRGYLTVFICVPLHCSYTKTHPGWNDIKVGIRELGADYAFFAPIDNLRFVGGKYVAWARHSFRGTLLDWIVFTARSARLPDATLHNSFANCQLPWSMSITCSLWGSRSACFYYSSIWS